jgi:hypothetical protein
MMSARVLDCSRVFKLLQVSFHGSQRQARKFGDSYDSSKRAPLVPDFRQRCESRKSQGTRAKGANHNKGHFDKAVKLCEALTVVERFS